MLSGQEPNPNNSQRENIHNISKYFRSWLTSVLTIAGLSYLVFILFSDIPKDKRFGYVEATIFGIILIINSEFISRLENLKLSGEGVEFSLDKVEAAATKIAEDKVEPVREEQKRLEYLLEQQRKTQEQQENIIEEQKSILGFLVLLNSLLTPHETAHLENLKYLGNNHARHYSFPHGGGGETVRNQLRKLANLGFIVRKEGRNIGSMRGEDVDITNYVKITPEGEKFLELRERQKILKVKEIAEIEG